MHVNSHLLLDVDNVTVRLGSETVLDRLSFCLHPGEFVGLIGPNGAGKTTLLRTLLGLQQPTSGTVTRDSVTIGYIPQRSAQYHGQVPLSVLEVVLLGSRGSTARAMQALEDVAMADAAHKRYSDLSGGQQQRVIIAKALAAQAELLILDEPTTGIDERSQTAFYKLLRKLQRKGITLLMVSHEVDTILRLVTRVICLNHTILYDGKPEHFEADAYLPSSYQAHHVQLHHHHHEGTPDA